ncbi:DUF4345 domain-containing protein [Flavobacterium sp. 25HG05S-40]|uniref:DUF4345 domain-containing protein n=1 Tax=Flavobacterium sp. 25HG05S-40 TaxID=3458682 RepID=UPI004043F41B
MKNLHLIISTIIVIPVGLLYGFQPELFFDVHINSADEQSIFKANMGMYLGFALLWVLGIFKPKFWQVATISNMIFMLGLGTGRIISMFLDEIPTAIYVFGALGELILGFYALYVLKKTKEIPN